MRKLDQKEFIRIGYTRSAKILEDALSKIIK